MKRAMAAVGLCVVLTSAACGSSSKKSSPTTSGTATTESASGAQTRGVKVDNHTDQFNGAFLAYFPNEVTVRPGDSVEFQSNYTGEPHTVTMGTLVEAGLEAAKGASHDGPPPPALASLPSLFPQGPGDAQQNAAQPCFLETGKPPADAADAKPCPKVTQPAFNGRQSYYNSGFLPDKATFKVKLADDIAPGTYHYYCNLHGADMQGSIKVEAKGAKIPSAAEVEAAGKAQLDGIVAKLATSYAAAKAGKYPFPGNLAGVGSPDAMNGLVNEFVPGTINAKVGQKVTWTVLGFHTISFGVPSDLPQDILAVAPDGGVHIVPKAVMPAGGPGEPNTPPSNGPPPTGPPPPPKVFSGGTYDGTGFHSSGLITESFPPALKGYSLTFTKAGTYTYQCLLHPGMAGVVNVT